MVSRMHSSSKLGIQQVSELKRPNSTPQSGPLAMWLGSNIQFFEPQSLYV